MNRYSDSEPVLMVSRLDLESSHGQPQKAEPGSGDAGQRGSRVRLAARGMTVQDESSGVAETAVSSRQASQKPSAGESLLLAAGGMTVVNPSVN